VPPGGLLGRHVLRRAQHLGVLGLHRVRALDLRDAEVEHLGPRRPLVLRDQEDVGRLEIAVDDAFAVGRRQRRADLADDRRDLGERHRAAPQAIGQRLADQELEHQVRRAVGQLVPVVDLDDVGVAQARRDLGLAAEPGERLGVGDVGVQDLDRHLLARQPDVAGDEHRAHAAAPEQPLDGVGLRDHGAHIEGLRR
jgi:hypothetical protein